jgi:hypothetical protein
MNENENTLEQRQIAMKARIQQRTKVVKRERPKPLLPADAKAQHEARFERAMKLVAAKKEEARDAEIQREIARYQRLSELENVKAKFRAEHRARVTAAQIERIKRRREKQRSQPRMESVEGILPASMTSWYLDVPCPICDKPMSKPVRDHCHERNVYRGVICDKCNLLLGAARDSIPVLQRAIVYLETRSPMI